MPKWMQLSDAALQLRISYHRTLRLAHIGEIEARRADGRWEVTKESVERLAKERSTQVSAPTAA
jgi:predicted site-specific integrase-resolvase